MSATQLQVRRGTAAQHANFTGAQAEITVVTDDWQIRVHDGVTPGGVPATVSVDSSNISDFDLTALSDGDTLIWQASANAWVASPIPTTSYDLDDLGDVDLSVAPLGGQALVYNAESQTWKPATVATGGGGGEGVSPYIISSQVVKAAPAGPQVLDIASESSVTVTPSPLTHTNTEYIYYNSVGFDGGTSQYYLAYWSYAWLPPIIAEILSPGSIVTFTASWDSSISVTFSILSVQTSGDLRTLTIDNVNKSNNNGYSNDGLNLLIGEYFRGIFTYQEAPYTNYTYTLDAPVKLAFVDRRDEVGFELPDQQNYLLNPGRRSNNTSWDELPSFAINDTTTHIVTPGKLSNLDIYTWEFLIYYKDQNTRAAENDPFFSVTGSNDPGNLGALAWYDQYGSRKFAIYHPNYTQNNYFEILKDYSNITPSDLTTFANNGGDDGSTAHHIVFTQDGSGLMQVHFDGVFVTNFDLSQYNLHPDDIVTNLRAADVHIKAIRLTAGPGRPYADQWSYGMPTNFIDYSIPTSLPALTDDAQRTTKLLYTGKYYVNNSTNDSVDTNINGNPLTQYRIPLDSGYIVYKKPSTPDLYTGYQKLLNSFNKLEITPVETTPGSGEFTSLTTRQDIGNQGDQLTLRNFITELAIEQPNGDKPFGSVYNGLTGANQAIGVEYNAIVSSQPGASNKYLVSKNSSLYINNQTNVETGYYDNMVVLGPNASASSGGTAVGTAVQAEAWGAIALGQSAMATCGDGIAIGPSSFVNFGQAQVAIGANVSNQTSNSYALRSGRVSRRVGWSYGFSADSYYNFNFPSTAFYLRDFQSLYNANVFQTSPWGDNGSVARLGGAFGGFSGSAMLYPIDGTLYIMKGDGTHYWGTFRLLVTKPHGSYSSSNPFIISNSTPAITEIANTIGITPVLTFSITGNHLLQCQFTGSLGNPSSVNGILGSVNFEANTIAFR